MNKQKIAFKNHFMNKVSIITYITLFFNPALSVLAADLSIIGSIPTTIQSQNPIELNSTDKQKNTNIIQLLKIELSENAQKAFSNRIEIMKQPITNGLLSIDSKAALPDNLDIGMNNVPVLNQGTHGSCVTFAIAGLIDSLIGKKDYVSELCSLALGKHFRELNPNYKDGWNGSYAPMVLAQYFNYGVVPISKQQKFGCGGLTSYPTFNPYNTGSSITPSEYTALSKPINNKYNWERLSMYDAAFNDATYNPNQMLVNVKKSLNDGNRVTFSVLLDGYQYNNGLLGRHKVYFDYDTWLLTPSIIDDINNGRVNAGHQMIIIGYDDNAVVKDRFGNKNKGLLTLRNSWGTSIGDYGNFYMSYDYFKAMTYGLYVIKKKDSQS